MTDTDRPAEWEQAEIALREWLDDDDAVSVLQFLKERGFRSGAEVERLQAENELLRAALHAWVEAGEKRLSGFRGASVPIMDEDRATAARIAAARRVLGQ